MGVCVPEEYGGAGADFVSYVLVLEELSRADAGVGVTVAVHTSAVTLPILAFGHRRAAGAVRAAARARGAARRVRADRAGGRLGRGVAAHVGDGATAAAGTSTARSGSSRRRATPARSSSSRAPTRRRRTPAASRRSCSTPSTSASRATRRSSGSTRRRRATSSSTRTSTPTGCSATRARASRSRCRRSTAAGSGSPRRRSGSRRRRSRRRAPTRSSASSSASRSASSRRSSTSSRTCRWRSTPRGCSCYRAAWLKEQGRPHAEEGAKAKLFASEMARRADRRGDPDLRRLRVHEGVPGRALLPRREDHRDLRGHERDPAARDRALDPRPAQAGARLRLDGARSGRAGPADADLHPRRRRGRDLARRRLARLEDSIRASRAVRGRRRAELAARRLAADGRSRRRAARADPERALRPRRRPRRCRTRRATGSCGSSRTQVDGLEADCDAVQRAAAGAEELRAARRDARRRPGCTSRATVCRRAEPTALGASERPANPLGARLPEPALRPALHPRAGRERAARRSRSGSLAARARRSRVVRGGLPRLGDRARARDAAAAADDPARRRARATRGRNEHRDQRRLGRGRLGASRAGGARLLAGRRWMLPPSVVGAFLGGYFGGDLPDARAARASPP